MDLVLFVGLLILRGGGEFGDEEHGVDLGRGVRVAVMSRRLILEHGNQ